MNKEQLLRDIKTALNQGIVSEAEVRSLFTTPATPPTVPNVNIAPKLTAVEIMFYTAGLVLFAAIMSMIAQSWSTGSIFVHILLSAGIGTALWVVAHILHKQTATTSIRKGMENSLILTGSLCIIVGGFIVTNEIIGGFQEVNFIPGALTFAVLGALHFAYDKLVKKDLVLLLAIFLSVAVFPALLFGILEDSTMPFDIWAAVLIASAVMLAYAARVVTKILPERASLGRAFDPLAAFLSLGTMFIASFTDFGLFWLVVLLASVFGLFYLSILMHNKHLLGNASFFLVVAVLTISFKYFSGGGVTISLAVAALGLLGSAAIATNINKKYFK